MISVLAIAGVSTFLLVRDGSGQTGYRVVNKLPHDPRAFTQGLLFHNGFFYESTGLNGQSSLRKIDPQTGKVLQERRLPNRYFAEGLALLNGVLIQLTWKAGKAFTYNSSSFEPLQSFDYPGEGWGLTYDGEAMIMSNGSDQLFFRNPLTFALIRTVQVKEKGRPVKYLNELEYIAGEVWANVWQTNDIVKISPLTGEVSERLSFAKLLAPQDRNGHEDVLNGIAYDAEQHRVFITGKFYSYIYELRL
jgi:glutamine cyclotransferase